MKIVRPFFILLLLVILIRWTSFGFLCAINFYVCALLFWILGTLIWKFMVDKIPCVGLIVDKIHCCGVMVSLLVF